MYLGIDLGTSGVKLVVISGSGDMLATAASALTVQRPWPLWSEQDPQAWWQATCDAMQSLSKQVDLQAILAIGLSGQMHGATFLDAQGQVLRPAILWNDGRSAAECAELESQVLESRGITGNIMMPGFTAPKVKWLQHHEPDNFSRIAKVLLPKDYLRFRMTDGYATDLSDAAGTMWLDVAKRDWDDSLLAATGLTRQQMPTLYEGNGVTGCLSDAVAQLWGMKTVPVVGGAGDNAAGAIGVGIVTSGQAMLSLGTSGVYFAVSDGVVANPEAAVHSFCHALPDTWHAMSVMLSAASCLDWLKHLVQAESVAELLAEVESAESVQSELIFLPYLSGERTPHNDPNAQGVFFGMNHDTRRYHLTQAVLEGVGFAFADALDAVHSVTDVPNDISLIGGGARSAYWGQMLADILEVPLSYRTGSEVGPALGAARLAQLAHDSVHTLAQICPVPQLVTRYQPNLLPQRYYRRKRQTFIELYQRLRDLFATSVSNQNDS